MKNIKQIKTALFTLISIVLLSFTVLQQTQEEELIVGIWVSNDEPDWKWQFKTDGKCYDYYDGILTNTYTYSIENTSPQCGQNVPVGELFSYLKLTNVNNSQDNYCYEILSLNDKNLQVRYLPRGVSGISLFNRQ